MSPSGLERSGSPEAAATEIGDTLDPYPPGGGGYLKWTKLGLAPIIEGPSAYVRFSSGIDPPRSQPMPPTPTR